MTGLSASEHSRPGEGRGWSLVAVSRPVTHTRAPAGGSLQRVQEHLASREDAPRAANHPPKRVCVRAGQGSPRPQPCQGALNGEHPLSSSLCWGLSLHSAPSHSHLHPFAGSRLAL